MTTVELSPGMLAVANVIAALRQAVNRTAGLTNLKAGPQDVMTTELVGIYGELAFAAWANVMPDLSIHLRAGSPDSMFRGRWVDVKSTRGRTQQKWYTDVRPDKRMHCYVFTAVDYGTVELCGWLTYDEVAARGARQQVWTREALRPMFQLWALSEDGDE